MRSQVFGAILAGGLLCGASSAWAQQPNLVNEFRRICLDTDGDVEVVSRLVSQNTEWVAAGEAEGIHTWTRAGANAGSLSVGRVARNGRTRAACSLSARPGRPEALTALPGSLGPGVGLLPGQQETYVKVSEGPNGAQRMTLINISNTADETTFVAVRPER